MFIKDNKRINPYAPYTSPDGTRYTKMPKELYEEIPDPQPPDDYSDETYYRTEQDDAPYVVFTKKSDEQLAQLAQSKLNQKSLAYLAETDWLVIRAAEGGKPLTDEVKANRQTARDSIVHPPVELGNV